MQCMQLAQARTLSVHSRCATSTHNSYRSLLPPVNFRHPWKPRNETIHELDRQKRVMINMRFEDADKDKNGRIDMQELRSLLESACSETVEGHLMQHWLSDAEVSRLMSCYDLDNSGDLSAAQFEHLVNDGLLLDEKLGDYQDAFAAVDTDGSGDISAQELSLALSRLGWPDSETAVDKVTAMMNKYGVNSHGHLDFNSFMSLMKDTMLDVRQVLAYLGARPDSPHTTRAVINAVAHDGLSLVMSSDDLDAALARAGGDKLVLLMAGTTWCTTTRAMVADVKALAAAYPSVRVLMLWGNVNAATKEFFRDELMVRSTPAFFLFRNGELLCHWGGAGSNPGGDASRLEVQLRRRLPVDSDMPPEPLYAATSSTDNY